MSERIDSKRKRRRVPGVNHERIMKHIRRIAERVHAGETPGAFSEREAIAAALLFTRFDWLPERYGDDVLGAIDRIGEDWFNALRET